MTVAGTTHEADHGASYILCYIDHLAGASDNIRPPRRICHDPASDGVGPRRIAAAPGGHRPPRAWLARLSSIPARSSVGANAGFLLPRIPRRPTPFSPPPLLKPTVAFCAAIISPKRRHRLVCGLQDFHHNSLADQCRNDRAPPDVAYRRSPAPRPNPWAGLFVSCLSV
jgi:hypothetical protein